MGSGGSVADRQGWFAVPSQACALAVGTAFSSSAGA